MGWINLWEVVLPFDKYGNWVCNSFNDFVTSWVHQWGEPVRSVELRCEILDEFVFVASVRGFEKFFHLTGWICLRMGDSVKMRVFELMDVSLRDWGEFVLRSAGLLYLWEVRWVCEHILLLESEPGHVLSEPVRSKSQREYTRFMWFKYNVCKGKLNTSTSLNPGPVCSEIIGQATHVPTAACSPGTSCLVTATSYA